MAHLIRTEDIKRLLGFQPETGLVTSFYLKVDPKCFSKDQLVTTTKNLLKEKIVQLGEDHPDYLGVKEDVKKIQRFVEQEFELRGRIRGLTIFSSSPNNFFQVFQVAQPVKNRVVVDPDPYLRPLVAILDEHKRIMLVIVDHRDARIFEIYMGEILEHEEFTTNIRGKIKEGGWYGLEERRIERKIENEIIRHYKQVADAILTRFRKNHFDYLFVGIKEEDFSTFSNLLHSYLKSRLKGRVNLHPKDHINNILAEAAEVERQIEEEEDNQILENLIDAVGKADLATFGIVNVLRSIHLGACQSLVVDDDYHQPGYECRECGYLTLQPENCQLCGKSTTPVEDVVEEGIEEVLLQRGEIKYITAGSPRLEEIGHIGAFLRFPV